MVTILDSKGKIIYEILTEEELESMLRELATKPGEKATFDQILRIIRERNYPI